MADLRFADKNNQKKENSASASGVLSTSATMDDTLFTMPVAGLVTAVYAVVVTPSGTANSTVDVKVGSTVVANELAVDATGVSVDSTFAPMYFSAGGSVSVVPGAVAPDTAGRIKIVVEYLETELTSGQYTD